MSARCFLLDTNVLSQVLREQGDPAIRPFIDQLDSDAIRISVVSLGEIQKGISLLPQGRKRHELEAWAPRLRSEFANGVVLVDTQVALRWGELTARMRMIGQNISVSDLLIAATALEHDLTVVTRNVRDFTPTGVTPARSLESAQESRRTSTRDLRGPILTIASSIMNDE